MASYPPPYSGDPYRAQREAVKAQARAAKFQARMQRQQWRTQMRLARRRSIAGPLVLITLGVIFLLIDTGHMSWRPVAEWTAHWWPLLLIGVGCISVAEWMIDQRTPPQIINGVPVHVSRRLGGGIIWLIFLIVFLGVGAHVAVYHMGNGFEVFDHNDFMRAIGDPHDSDDSLTQPLSAGGSLVLDNAHGNVTVAGTSTDGQMHIAIHREVYTMDDDDARKLEDRLRPQVHNDNGRVSVTIEQVDGAHADLDVQVPASLPVFVTVASGNVNLQALVSNATVTANKGDVTLENLRGAATVHMHHDDSVFSVQNVTGDVTLDGRAGDINMTDVTGGVTVRGDFFGDTHLERVHGPFRFESSRTQLEMARLDGSFEISGSDLTADQVLGPVRLKTRNRDITLDRVQGELQIDNSGKGSVNVKIAPPLGAMAIANHDGSVDLGLPAAGGFMLNVTTKDGTIENDFGLTPLKGDDRSSMSGTIAKGGPMISIQTAEGDVTVRKATVLALPPLPPLPPVGAGSLPPSPPSPPPASGPGKAMKHLKPPPTPVVSDNF